MSFLDMNRTGRRWLIVAAAAAVIAGAFTAGLIFGPREVVPALAQPAPEETPVSNDPATQPTIELDPMLPLSEVGEVTIEIIREQVFPDPRTTAAGRRAGGGPPLGNYVYLHGAHRYVSLPDDVKLIDKIGLGTCILPPSECPKLPLYTFQRGEAKVALDTMGVMWDAGEGTDFSAFPFFVFEDADGQ
jgi:hypothetical protein